MSVNRASDRVSLIDIDDDFWSAVPAQDRELARRAVTATRVELPRGPWVPETPDGRRPFAALVLAGALVQEVHLSGRRTAQLLGPGEFLRPWRQAPTELPCSLAWTAVDGAAVALLDGHFLLAARRWPALITVLHQRLGDQLDASARRVALCALPRVEDRVLGLFWQLADTWGTVGPEGISIRLPLTHELIGRMIGAKRPTVSLALTSLAAEHRLRRGTDDTWVLSPLSRSVLATEV